MATYLYRGVDLNHGTPPVLADGVIKGESPLIVEGSALSPGKTVTKGTTLGELVMQVDWYDENTYNAGTTGGVTHRIMGSARFGGGLRTRVILDNSRLPFERVYYEYDWYDDHPGALPHILTTSAGELRLKDEGLWAIIEKTRYAPEKWRSLSFDQQYKVQHWGADNLPATSDNSPFAKESEWIAPQEDVDVSGAIDSVVHVLGRKRRSDKDPKRRAFDTFNRVEKEHPETQNHPHYVLVVTGRHSETGGPYELDEIVTAYGRTSGSARQAGDGLPLDPTDVPDYVRGVQ